MELKPGSCAKLPRACCIIYSTVGILINMPLSFTLQGDSGGPLVCSHTGDPIEKNNSRGILVGIATGTLETVSSLFARVSYYHNYIERNKCLKSPRFCCSVVNTFLLSQIILFYCVLIYLSFFYTRIYPISCV